MKYKKKDELKSSQTLDLAGNDDKGRTDRAVAGLHLRKPVGGHKIVISRMIAVIYYIKPRYWFVALVYLNNSINWLATD